jgi:hypothetical protein
MQCANDLKATGLRLCLLLNLGEPRLELTRGPWSINRAESSACFACIAFLHLR